MSAFSWLRNLFKPTESVATLDIGRVTPDTDKRNTSMGPLSQVHWLAAGENPFGVELLDCSAFATSMVSTTSSVEVATRFSQLRKANGEHCRGKEPPTPVVTNCRLEYPFDRRQDGPLFPAEEMEDKWDIYLFDGNLYFARSWTGDLVYKARLTFEHSNAVVTKISGSANQVLRGSRGRGGFPDQEPGLRLGSSAPLTRGGRDTHRPVGNVVVRLLWPPRALRGEE